MQKTFQTFQQISLYLQNAQMVKQVELLQKMNENADVYVPLIGQFSAGKSNLLNNLLERKILPTMLRETTAFSTFIRYDAEERAYLTTKDGNRYDLTLEQLLQLSQQTLTMTQSLSELLNIPVAEGEIATVHVHLNHPLLQNGLVFVDTPGLNTLIQAHENRTQTLLPQANMLIYVLGKNLTDSDLTIIRQIDHLGIDMIFVRTKLDDVKSSEGEFVQDVLQKDIQHLKKMLGKEPVFLGVSNDSVCLQNTEWRLRMEDLYNYLSNNVTNQAAQLKEHSITKRLLMTAHQMLADLENRKKHFEDLKQIDLQVLEEQVQELKQQLLILQSKLEQQYERGIIQFGEVEQQVYEDVKQVFDKVKKRFENKLHEYSTIQNLQEESAQFSQHLIGEATSEANRMLKESVEQYIQGMTVESNELLAEVEQQIEQKQELSLKLNIEAPSIEGVFEDVEFIEEQLVKVQSSKEEEILQQNIHQLHQEREQLENEMLVVSQQKNEANMERIALGNYQPRYREEQSSNVANALGKLGMGMDMALLFLPGTTLVKGAEAVAVGASTISKTTKITKVAQQTAQIAEKASKAATAIDKVKDALYIAKTVQEKARNNEIVKAKPGLLDMVTVEFWFRKTGELLDGPPKQVEDEEYRQQFLAAERELVAKYEATKLEELNRLQQLNLLSTREERLKKELEIERRNQQRIQQDLQRSKERLRQAAKMKQVEVYRKELIQQFNEAVDGLYRQQNEFMSQFLALFIQKLPSSISIRLQQEVNIYRQQLQDAIEMKKAGEQEAAQTEQQIMECIEFLQSYIQKAVVTVS